MALSVSKCCSERTRPFQVAARGWVCSAPLSPGHWLNQPAAGAESTQSLKMESLPLKVWSGCSCEGWAGPPGPPRAALPVLTLLRLLASQLRALPLSDYQRGGLSGPGPSVRCKPELSVRCGGCLSAVPSPFPLTEGSGRPLPGWEFIEAPNKR